MATSKFYGKFLQSLCNKEIDIDSDTLKVMLCTSSYTPDQDAHRYKSDITNEVTGTGYTAGGVTVTPVTVSYDSATNKLSFSSTSNPTWTTSTITARYAILYDSTPATDATRPLILYVDFGADISSTAATFSVPWDPTNGIGYITAA
ncbi:hypothetical protein [Mycolicibacterium llatzerense]|uniref:hypothetical protein n=1 Tax=Mycolicibacterium llatzerense TaxID=280871 RepID=UPI0021B5780E|nr:hypothetical protein [Mycolicibacterium llatzerense]MCT7366513.1 hypothetical protein [Mycolicibacterium llatzerense]